MKFTFIAGSNRQGATSTKLCEYLQHLLEERGHSVDLIDLYQHPVPFYSPGESYSGHEGLARLGTSAKEAEGLILASPEYHGGMSGVLKNALDHLSQEHFSGKPVLSISSAGGAVGVSSLGQMQAIVRNLHGINSPEWISIGGSQRRRFEDYLDESEAASFHDLEERIARVLESFVKLTGLIHRPCGE
ncbi:NAD(P)H-dependent oxidoreductase [Paenibacillus chitinolyticus]|uniref:NADPH-dependent FMN reductase n=1 Tax=Paenibacillus chitinolyticus TaxID=79263 RepID=UPI002DBEE7A9|nr:NADPH-dependent FMN reductase [Paenibacillus chitinolyticus]MEC0248584.1 NAD(P)H-dependent oxidoreductase [Paenibacillus chitinolyticus]